jgi:hypothetical protein
MRRFAPVLLFFIVAVLIVAVLIVAVPIVAVPAHSRESKEHWVSLDSSGRLIYRVLPQGDRIVDFSYAGYMGGGVSLPRLPAVQTVAPTGADDTAAIQRAIDQVSSMPLKDGFRGAVLLAPGTFLCSAALNINTSGVVLRGSGPLAGGTTLRLTGPPHVAIEVAGLVSGKEGIQVLNSAGPSSVAPGSVVPGSAVPGSVAHIVEAYVPSAAQSITLDDASSFAPGDTIRITRYTTPEWLHFMGMDRMARDSNAETWVGNSISTLRVVTARHGNELGLDVPLTDSYDRKYLRPEGAEVVKVAISGRIEQVGIESLHILAPARSVAFTDPLFRAVTLNSLRDGWVRDVLIDDTTEGIDVGGNASRITIEDVSFRHKTTITSPAKPADFMLGGTQLLMLRCASAGNDLFYVMTGARNQGPNVVLDSKFIGNGHVQPHQRWATGLLVDNTQVPQGGIDMMNRGEMGTGHGWTMGWGVVWNSSAADLIIQNPPGAANWSIGTSGHELTAPMKVYGVSRRELGPDLPQGFIESPNHRVLPESLYRAQLSERLGASALKALDPQSL